MRVAPVAMMFAANQPDEASDVFHLGKRGGPADPWSSSGYLSAAVFAVILHAILCGYSLRPSIDRAVFIVGKPAMKKLWPP